MAEERKCDFCDSPARVHETIVKKGSQTEVHLCEFHAKEAGIPLPNPAPFGEVHTQFVISTEPAASGESPSGAAAGPAGKLRASRKTCPTCGLSFARFRQNGIVGCPDCYRIFERHLAPLIERAHNGAVNHVGKAPRRAGTAIDRRLLIQQLLRDLDDAVAAEQYERAAELRDRLTSLKTETEKPGPRI